MARMQTWQLESTPAPHPVAADAVALLFRGAPDATPAESMLAFLNRLVAVDYLSLVEYVPNRREGARAPELAEGRARPGVTNVTPDCFAHYRRYFWRHDEGTRVAHEVGQRRVDGLVAMHVLADDICITSWRQEIYDRAHLAGRLSFFYSPVAGRTFAINLYRDRAQGDFGRAEIERLLGVASLLKQAHGLAMCSSAPLRDAADRDQRVTLAEAALRRRVPQLSVREAAVCARISCGMSADGIAADLAVAVSTVATLRKRAYGKLALHGIVGGRLQLAMLLH
jgi:DNA-binding CsgD family transcriptional regulator